MKGIKEKKSQKFQKIKNWKKNPKKSKKKRRKTLKSEKFKINTPTIQNLSKMVLKNWKIGKNLKKILFLRIKKIIIIILPYKKCLSLSFSKWGDWSSTRAFQSSPFLNIYQCQFLHFFFQNTRKNWKLSKN